MSGYFFDLLFVYGSRTDRGGGGGGGAYSGDARLLPSSHHARVTLCPFVSRAYKLGLG